MVMSTVFVKHNEMKYYCIIIIMLRSFSYSFNKNLIISYSVSESVHFDLHCCFTL